MDITAAYPPMKASDLLTIGAETPANIIEDLDAYFAAFVSPKDGEAARNCIGCGESFDGFKQVFGIGVAHAWGLAHGEAFCTGCGYPSRGIHYIKDRDGEELITIRNVFLQYLPEIGEAA